MDDCDGSRQAANCSRMARRPVNMVVSRGMTKTWCVERTCTTNATRQLIYLNKLSWQLTSFVAAAGRRRMLGESVRDADACTSAS